MQTGRNSHRCDLRLRPSPYRRRSRWYRPFNTNLKPVPPLPTPDQSSPRASLYFYKLEKSPNQIFVVDILRWVCIKLLRLITVPYSFAMNTILSMFFTWSQTLNPTELILHFCTIIIHSIYCFTIYHNCLRHNFLWVTSFCRHQQGFIRHAYELFYYQITSEAIGTIQC